MEKSSCQERCLYMEYLSIDEVISKGTELLGDVCYSGGSEKKDEGRSQKLKGKNIKNIKNNN